MTVFELNCGMEKLHVKIPSDCLTISPLNLPNCKAKQTSGMHIHTYHVQARVTLQRLSLLPTILGERALATAGVVDRRARMSSASYLTLLHEGNQSLFIKAMIPVRFSSVRYVWHHLSDQNRWSLVESLVFASCYYYLPNITKTIAEHCCKKASRESK